MRNKIVGIALLAFACGFVGWFVARNVAAPAQAQDKPRIKVGKYEYVSAGLMTVVAIDTETNKMYALAPPGFGGFDREEPMEFVWVPIEKFEDVEKYRKWWRQRRDEAFKDRMERERMLRDRYYDQTTTKAFRDPPTQKFEPTTKAIETKKS